MHIHVKVIKVIEVQLDHLKERCTKTTIPFPNFPLSLPFYKPNQRG